MDPITLSMISMGIGGAIKVGADLFNDTGAKQANLMREQATLKASALEETMRRAEGQQTQVLSSTKARMAGSGFDSGSRSFTDYLSGMAQQFTAQNEFTQQTGMKSIDLMRKAADIVGDPLKQLLAAGTDLMGSGMGIVGMTKSGGVGGGGSAASLWG